MQSYTMLLTDAIYHHRSLSSLLSMKHDLVT